MYLKMLMMINSITLRSVFLFLMAPAIMLCQTRDQVIAGTIKNYDSNEPLQFTATYNLYKSVTDKKIIETYSSLYCKQGKNLYLKINDTEFVSNGSMGVKVNHSEHLMAVSKAEKDRKKEANSFLQVFKDFREGKFKDKGGYWEIELLGKNFSEYPYNRIVMEIGKDYCIRRQKFYFSTGMNFSKDFSKTQIQYPLLEVIFSPVSRKPVNIAQFDVSRFFSGTYKKLKVSAKYKDYKILYTN